MRGAPPFSKSRGASGVDVFAMLGTYAPTWVEVAVVVGVVSLGALAFIVMSRMLLAGRKQA